MKFHDIPEIPEFMSDETWTRRVRLILEEFHELAKAQAFHSVDGVADGLVDLTWVVMGTAVEAGLPFNALWNEVRRANMDKVRDGIVSDACGKVIKPPGWKPPDIVRILANASDPSVWCDNCGARLGERCRCDDGTTV